MSGKCSTALNTGHLSKKYGHSAESISTTTAQQTYQDDVTAVPGMGRSTASKFVIVERG